MPCPKLACALRSETQELAVQALERDAADMAADTPKLEARAVQLTEQLQREEKVRR